MGSVDYDVKCPVCGLNAYGNCWYHSNSTSVSCSVCGYYDSHMIFYECCLSEDDPRLENGYLNEHRIGRGHIIAYDRGETLRLCRPFYTSFVKTDDNEKEAEEFRQSQELIVLESTFKNGVLDIEYAEEDDYIERHYRRNEMVKVNDEYFLMSKYPVQAWPEYEYESSEDDTEGRRKERLSHPDIFARIKILPITDEKKIRYRMQYAGHVDPTFLDRIIDLQNAVAKAEAKRDEILYSVGDIMKQDVSFGMYRMMNKVVNSKLKSREE